MATDVPSIDRVHGFWRRAGRYALLVFIALVILFPIYTTVVAAFKPGAIVLHHPLLPESPTTSVVKDAWTAGRLGHYLLNSTFVSLIVVLAQVTTSALSAYAFAFLKFPLKNVIFAIFLSTLLVPAEATIVTNLRTIQSLHWIDSFKALTVPFLATAFGTFLLRQVFLQIPNELREAAEMDGLGHWGFLREVALPLVRPSLGALGLFSFLSTWNQYLWPVLVTNKDAYRTVQSGLRALAKSSFDRPNLVMAGTVVAAVPIFVVLIVFQRQLVRGLTAGAVKG
jgi:sn-glycerol 3-phosphate transport system permease protein